MGWCTYVHTYIRTYSVYACCTFVYIGYICSLCMLHITHVGLYLCMCCIEWWCTLCADSACVVTIHVRPPCGDYVCHTRQPCSLYLFRTRHWCRTSHTVSPRCHVGRTVAGAVLCKPVRSGAKRYEPCCVCVLIKPVQ